MTKPPAPQTYAFLCKELVKAYDDIEACEDCVEVFVNGVCDSHRENFADVTTRITAKVKDWVLINA